MKEMTKKLLQMILNWKGSFEGAYNIREDGICLDRQSSENIDISPMQDKSGIIINVKPKTKAETIYIPACLTQSKVTDLVYNDFYIGKDAEITINAGCGVCADGEEESLHQGVHRFFLEPGASVIYQEKHIGIGEGRGKKIINPQTYIEAQEDSRMEINTIQLSGVDRTNRTSHAILWKNAKLQIRENLMTNSNQFAETYFTIDLNGDGAGVELISRSVAKGCSSQHFQSKINGNVRCTGYSACDAIIMEQGTVCAVPQLYANNIDAELIHEAAIGKIAGKQILKLMTLGLTEEEAQAKIVEGFLMGSGG